jgi:hypothetical protein
MLRVNYFLSLASSSAKPPIRPRKAPDLTRDQNAIVNFFARLGGHIMPSADILDAHCVRPNVFAQLRPHRRKNLVDLQF